MSDAPPSTASTVQGHRRLAGAAVIMGLSALASRVLGLVRDSVIAGKLGSGSESDIYYSAFIVPDLLFFLIAGGALSSAFIPVFTEKVTLGDEEGAWKLFHAVATLMFLIVGVFIVVGEIFAIPITRLATRNQYNPDELAQTVYLTRIVLPAQICFFLGGIMMGAQQVKKRFLLPSLGPNIYNLGIIAGGLVLTPFLGVQGFCWGALGGAIIGNFGLQMVGIRQVGGSYRPSLDWRNPDVQRVAKLMLPVILGLALPQVSLIFNRIFATELGRGPLSALTRGNMVMQAPLAIFAQAMGIAIFPTLSALAAKKDLVGLRETASLGIRLILFLTIPSAVFMCVLAEPIIALLFQHGKFDAVATQQTATALIYYCIGLFAWSSHAVISRGFYALQDTKTPVVIGTAVTLIFLPLNILFRDTLGLGFRGLALATSVAALLHGATMMVVLRRRLGGLDEVKLALSAGKSLLAATIAGALTWLVCNVLTTNLASVPLKAKSATILVVGAIVGGGIYLGCAIALRHSEADFVKQMVMKRRSRGSASPKEG